jgi:hypothetical protein
MRRAFGFILATVLIAAGCGGHGSPTTPSPSGSSGAAVITGSVQGAVGGLTAASSGAALTGVTVSVVGTTISSTVDAGGRFTLTNVPPGTVQLQLTGGGVNATVTLTSIAPSQTVDLVVAVTGTSASVESELRSGAGDAQLEGRVESLPPTMPALTFKAAGRTVKTDGSTRFFDGSQSRTFADLQIGMRVHATGTLAGDTLTAAVVELQNSNTTIPVEVNGVIDTLGGSASDFHFNIGSRLVKGDALTSFFGDGDTPDTFASLKEGSRVEVKGQQKDGYVYATRIHVNGSNPDDGQDSSASIHGVLSAIGGSKPNFVLTVGTTTVNTSATTEVKRRGDVQTLDALKLGQSLHVVGVRQSNGSIDARLIEIDDDQTGGEFEIQGALGGLQGTCPAIRFGVNGFAVTTSGATTFEGGACSSLKSGDKVTVNGLRQADGSVAATKVKKG